MKTCGRQKERPVAIMDEFTCECLAILVAKKLTSEDVVERL